MAERSELVAGYFPVIHDGYLELLDRHPEAQVGVFDHTILSQFDYLRKDIRALAPEKANQLINGIGRSSRLIGQRALADIMHRPGVILPDDDVSRSLMERYTGSRATLEPVFLRWHRDNVNVNVPVLSGRTVEMSGSDPIVQVLRQEAEQSTNWWRRVGAAVIDGDTIVASAHNNSVPTPYTSALDGDPRITAKRGVGIETSIDIHAEARLIAQLARDGISSEGKTIAVSTFPCPNCAKLIAESGLNACYFVDGYAMLDGQSVLEASGVEIVKILTDDEQLDDRTLKPYPSSS